MAFLEGALWVAIIAGGAGLIGYEIWNIIVVGKYMTALGKEAKGQK